MKIGRIPKITQPGTIRLALFLLGFAGVAGFVRGDNGPAHGGLAAGADSASTAMSNPAGLTLLGSTEWEIQVLSVFSESEFHTTATNVTGRLISETDGFLVIPSIYYARPLGKKWTAGGAVSVTGGIGADYPDDWVGRYFSQNWGLAYVAVTPTVGYRINEKFSVGGGVSLNYAILRQESAVLNIDAGYGDGKMELDADDFVPSYILSALYEPAERTRFGVSWRSETEPTLSGTPEFSNLGPTRQQQLMNSGALDRKIEIGARMPQSVLAGLYQEFAGGSALTFDLLWLDFSEFALTQFSVDDDSLEGQFTQYDDIWVLSLGGRWPAGTDWEVRAGGLYLTEGVEDKHRTFILRIDRIWGIGGGFLRRMGGNKSMSLNLNYYRLGDAPVETRDLPLVGQVTGEYSTNHALMIDFSFRWKR